MLDSIESAIEDIKAGKMVIVVDDEDRENEGDFVTASRNATPEVINFMSKHGRGLICVPMLEERCKELGLDLMVNNNTALHETAFTVSVDLLGHGCTTGISANDRSKTIQALIDPANKPGRFRQARTHISPDSKKRRRAAPYRPYRSNGRPCPAGGL
jgi:3,4-dihydroxy 2-butanone 4-phosphate synthase/GTP cyclohydrolase II